MAENRATRGVPLPGLWQACVLVAAVVGAWLLWSEFRHGRQPAGNDVAQHDPGENLRTMLQSSREGKLGLDQLTTLLRSDDPRTRRNALMVLAEMGHEASETLPAVRGRFADDDSLVRPAALAAFMRICDDQNEANTAAAAFLADSETQVRELAARMLRAAGPAAIPALIAVAHSENPETRRLVIRLLPEADKDRDAAEVNAALRSLFDDPESDFRCEAIKAVVERGAASVAEVHGWLRNEDPQVAAEGLRAVDWLGPDAAPTILPDLAALLEDADSARSWASLRAISHFKSGAAPLIPVILRRVAEGNFGGLQVAQTLIAIGADPKDVVPILIPLLASNKPAYNDCWQAGELLAIIDPAEARRQVSRLIGKITSKENGPLEHEDADLNALSGLGSLAQEAIPLLIRLLSHSDRSVRRHAISTLSRLGPDAAPATPALMSLIDQEPNAVWALGRIGPAAHSAVPRLLKLLDDRRAREYAARALGQIGDASPQVLAALRQQLTKKLILGSSEDINLPQLRAASVEALALLADDAETTLPDLLPLLKETGRNARYEAILAIGRLSGDRREAIEPLIKLLAEDDKAIRTAATLSLGQIGPQAKAALPALSSIVADRRNAIARSSQRRPNENEKEYRAVSLAEAAQWAISAIESPMP